MGHLLPPPPATSEGRIARSSRLLRVAWRLVRDDRAMLTLAACGVAAMVAAGLAFVWFAGLPSGDVRSYGGLLLGVTVALFPATFVGTFLGVAVAAAADAALRGERLTVREALAVSRRRVRQIAGWSVLAAGVGALLSALAERLPFGDRLAAWALGGAWDLLTMFALPVLALEGRAAPGCVRRSASLLRDRWGEGVAGTVTITAATTAATLPIAVVLMGGLTLSIFAPGRAWP